MFAKKGELVTKLQTRWYPPPVDLTTPQTKPSPSGYFHRRLFLWMPRRMWKIDFKCPNCKDPQRYSTEYAVFLILNFLSFFCYCLNNYNSANRSLRSKGPYNRVRLVLDLNNLYYLGVEYMSCNECNGTFILWDRHILGQLPDGLRTRFPVVMTHKFACDVAVVSLLRSRTLGNSSTALHNNILELHSEEWSHQYLWYLSDCDRHRKGRQSLNMKLVEYSDAPPLHSLPTYKWFLACYLKDVWDHLPLLKAAMTSVYGDVLKIDSTKKVRGKLC